jgi:CRP-like cAMP-binding protein
METMQRGGLYSALRRCGFLANLGDEDIALLIPSAKRVQYQKNVVVFHEGEPCHGFYVVEDGAVKLYKESTEGKEQILHVAVPGDCFGEAALFLSTGYPASAATIKDSSLVLLKRDEFLNALRNNPKIALALIGSMAIWAQRLVALIENLALKDSGQRLAAYLLSRCSNSCGKAVVELEITKQVLAAHLGIAGETLSRLLARFEASGLVQLSGRKIRLLAPERLRSVAAGSSSAEELHV